MKFSKLTQTEQTYVNSYRADQSAARLAGNTARWVSYDLKSIMYMGRGTVARRGGRVLFLVDYLAGHGTEA